MRSVARRANDDDFEPYSYDSTPHLTRAQALERYRRAVKNHDSLVVINDESCGHWTVQEHITPAAKTKYLHEIYASYVGRALRLFFAK